jgi:large subunit ribosomal protein L19
MVNKLELFNKTQVRKNLPDIRPGDTVRVLQKIKEGDKHKAQTFEGQILAIKHGKGISATITVRKIILGVGVEKIFPIHSPNIEKIEIIRRGKARRAKLYYLRTAKGKDARLKREEYKELPAAASEEGEPSPAGREEK